jgi:hypothetical protein
MIEQVISVLPEFLISLKKEKIYSRIKLSSNLAKKSLEKKILTLLIL